MGRSRRTERLGVGLFDQTAQQVVGKIEFLFADAELFAVGGGQTLDGQQAVCVVVGVVLPRVRVELGQQSANAIAFEFGTAFWAFDVSKLLGIVPNPAAIRLQV